MLPVVTAVIILGTVLVVAWILMTLLALGRLGSAGQTYFGPKWREMVLGFFSKDPAWVIAGWWFTTTLSTVGWLMGFAGAFVELDRRTGSNLTPADEEAVRRCEYYMQMCAAQLAVLLAWTAVVVGVMPWHHLGFRLLCVALLLVVTVIYAFTAYAFIRIDDSWMPPLYYYIAAVFICVHAAHGLLWDCAYWGYTYIRYDNSGAPVKETLAYMRVDKLEGYRSIA